MKDVVVRAFGLSPMCRVCLSEKKCIYNIFNKYLDDTTLATAIMTCAPVQISSYDDLPSVVCERCVKELERFARLRERCIESDKVLRKYNNALTPHKFEFVDLTGDPLSNAYEFTEEPAVFVEATALVDAVHVQPPIDATQIKVENGALADGAAVRRDEPKPTDEPAPRRARRPRYDYREYDDDDFEAADVMGGPTKSRSKRKRRGRPARDSVPDLPDDAAARHEKKRNRTVDATDERPNAVARTRLAPDRPSRGRT